MLWANFQYYSAFILSPKIGFSVQWFLSRPAISITTWLNLDLNVSYAEFELEVPVPVIWKNIFFFLSILSFTFFLKKVQYYGHNLMVCLVLGARHYSFSVDIWSVGCIFGELLGRRILFQVSPHLPAYSSVLNDGTL